MTSSCTHGEAHKPHLQLKPTGSWAGSGKETKKNPPHSNGAVFIRYYSITFNFNKEHGPSRSSDLLRCTLSLWTGTLATMKLWSGKQPMLSTFEAISASSPKNRYLYPHSTNSSASGYSALMAIYCCSNGVYCFRLGEEIPARPGVDPELDKLCCSEPLLLALEWDWDLVKLSLEWDSVISESDCSSPSTVMSSGSATSMFPSIWFLKPFDDLLSDDITDSPSVAGSLGVGSFSRLANCLNRSRLSLFQEARE